MIFNSIPFIIFFLPVVIVYYLVPCKFRYIWLLAASIFFYFSQSTAFATLLIISVFITYAAGLVLGRCSTKTGQNITVAVSALLNLGILLVFKYTDFFLELFGADGRLNLILPIGISFYTFMAVSYTVDLYRHKIEPEKNILKLALYLSFFLSILSGPINRACDFLPQLSCKVKFDLENVKVGLQKMLWGYFLKLCIAARLSILVDNVYGNCDGYQSLSLVVAAVSYLFMLYCDFEGYSQIAIGAAKIMGITMLENFRQPFYSLSMSELWRRWHVSLSTWFRDYLYIPLGGNRKGTARKYLNLMIVLFLSGVWHGANLTFFIWGLLNGAYIVIGQITLPYRDELARKINCPEKVRVFAKRLGVYVLYAFTFIFFANDSVKSAWMVIKGIVLRMSFSASQITEIFSLGLGRMNLLLTIAMSIFVFVIDGKCHKEDCDFAHLMTKTPTLVRWIIYYAILVLILFSANLTGKEFIYSKM